MPERKIDYNAQHPLWMYKRLALPATESLFVKHTKPSFEYMLYGLIVSVPSDIEGDPPDLYPPVSLQLIHYCRNRLIFEDPIIPALFSTPGVQDLAQERPYIYYHEINYLYSNNEPIIIKVTGQIAVKPPYVDIVAVGQNLLRDYRK